jgi:hypothetical protein
MADDKNSPPGPTISIDPVLYRKDDKGEPLLDTEGKKVVERALGHFEFRVPTFGDAVETGVRRSVRLRGQGGLVDAVTERLAEILSELPFLAISVPDGWSWEKLVFPKDAGAAAEVYRAYTEALEKF